jgi:hypothetical protein
MNVSSSRTTLLHGICYTTNHTRLVFLVINFHLTLNWNSWHSTVHNHANSLRTCIYENIWTKRIHAKACSWPGCFLENCCPETVNLLTMGVLRICSHWSMFWLFHTSISRKHTHTKYVRGLFKYKPDSIKIINFTFFFSERKICLSTYSPWTSMHCRHCFGSFITPLQIRFVVVRPSIFAHKFSPRRRL